MTPFDFTGSLVLRAAWVHIKLYVCFSAYELFPSCAAWKSASRTYHFFFASSSNGDGLYRPVVTGASPRPGLRVRAALRQALTALGDVLRRLQALRTEDPRIHSRARGGYPVPRPTAHRKSAHFHHPGGAGVMDLNVRGTSFSDRLCAVRDDAQLAVRPGNHVHRDHRTDRFAAAAPAVTAVRTAATSPRNTTVIKPARARCNRGR